MAIGSEGILGIITEAWMRIQARPQYRASAGRDVSHVHGRVGGRAPGGAGQAVARQLPPAGPWRGGRPPLGWMAARALLILGFESNELPQDENIRQAVAIARDTGGTIDEADIRISSPGTRGDESAGGDTGRQGAVGAWRNAFLGAPYQRNITTGLGLVAETLETAITWDHWPAMDEMVRGALQDTLDRVCGGGSVSCRFTHVYPDGPAPYYTWEGMGRRGAELEMYAEVKQAASDAIMAAGGHHHPPPRRRPAAPALVRPAEAGACSRRPCAPPNAPWTPTAC